MAYTRLLADLQINTDLARTILIGFIRDEINRVGFERAVIALSGGVDSSLVAYLIVEALGAENVLGVRMPYKTSAADSSDHAGLVIDALKIADETIGITAMVEPLIERFPKMNPVRTGNIMARQRMVVIYDRSADWGGLVVGTSNKTETLLGYTTQFGDNAAAIQPIADLYKNQVRQLARAMGVPQEIIDKAPSADLWPGQTDEGELGYTYDDVDQLLYWMVDKRHNLKEAVAAGFDKELVENVWKRVRQTHYKRHMPVIAKLSQRTVGYDFLYMRDWGT